MTTMMMKSVLVSVLLIAGAGAAPALAQDASGPAATAATPAGARAGALQREVDEDDDGDKIAGHYRSPAVEIVVPVASFLFVLGIVAVPLYFGFRKERQRQETLRAIIDKGGAIPPELLASAESREDTSRKDRRRGVVLIAAALGIAGFLAVIGAGNGVGIALIPMCIGGGYLVVWRLDQRG
jgi:Domain of unknown function (DUF6249)